MKRQKQTLGFGFALVMLTSFVAAPNANAGSGPAIGVGTGSSSFIGTPPTVSAPASGGGGGSNVSVGANGQVSVPATVQVRVNSAAQSIVSTTPANSPANVVIVLIISRGSSSAAVNTLQVSFTSAGVSAGSVQALISALSAIFGGGGSAATPGVPVAQLMAPQFLASSKGLTVSKIAQTVETPKVDVTQLNAAINAYNNIILESSPETLQQLAKNEEFIATGKILRELRSALNN